MKFSRQLELIKMTARKVNTPNWSLIEYSCSVCGSTWVDGEKPIHVQECPVMIAKREEEQEEKIRTRGGHIDGNIPFVIGENTNNRVIYYNLRSNYFAIDCKHAWYCGEGGKIWFSCDNGKNWTLQENGCITPKEYTKIEFDRAGETGVAMTEDGLMSITHDGGQHWKLLTYDWKENWSKIPL